MIKDSEFNDRSVVDEIDGRGGIMPSHKLTNSSSTSFLRRLSRKKSSIRSSTSSTSAVEMLACQKGVLGSLGSSFNRGQRGLVERYGGGKQGIGSINDKPLSSITASDLVTEPSQDRLHKLSNTKLPIETYSQSFSNSPVQTNINQQFTDGSMLTSFDEILNITSQAISTPSSHPPTVYSENNFNKIQKNFNSNVNNNVTMFECRDSTLSYPDSSIGLWPTASQENLKSSQEFNSSNSQNNPDISLDAKHLFNSAILKVEKDKRITRWLNDVTPIENSISVPLDTSSQ